MFLEQKVKKELRYVIKSSITVLLYLLPNEILDIITIIISIITTDYQIRYDLNSFYCLLYFLLKCT